MAFRTKRHSHPNHREKSRSYLSFMSTRSSEGIEEVSKNQGPLITQASQYVHISNRVNDIHLVDYVHFHHGISVHNSLIWSFMGSSREETSSQGNPSFKTIIPTHYPCSMYLTVFKQLANNEYPQPSTEDIIGWNAESWVIGHPDHLIDTNSMFSKRESCVYLLAKDYQVLTDKFKLVNIHKKSLFC
jgi:hypothetical protein